MDGSAAASGFDFQDGVAVVLCCALLADQPLEWLPYTGTRVLPDKLICEGRGIPEDIQVVNKDKTVVNIQAKQGLGFDRRFKEAVEQLIIGLQEAPTSRGVLAVDDSTTSEIGDRFRNELVDLRSGLDPNPSKALAFATKCCDEHGIDHSVLLRLDVVRLPHLHDWAIRFLAALTAMGIPNRTGSVDGFVDVVAGIVKEASIKKRPLTRNLILVRLAERGWPVVVTTGVPSGETANTGTHSTVVAATSIETQVLEIERLLRDGNRIAAAAIATPAFVKKILRAGGLASDWAVTLANCLVRLERPVEGIAMLEAATDLTLQKPQLQWAVSVSFSKGRTNWLLKYVRRRIHDGETDSSYRWIEIGCLQAEGRFLESHRLLQEWVEAHPYDQTAYLNYASSLAYLAQGSSEIQKLDLSRLPKPGDVPNATLGTLIAMTISECGLAREGASYAWQVFKRFPEARGAQLTLIRCALMPTHSIQWRAIGTVVEDSSLVAIDGRGKTWHIPVIKEALRSRLSRVVGLKKGASITVTLASGRRFTGKITRITHPHLATAQRLLAEWGTNWPNDEALQERKLRKGNDDDLHAMLDEVQQSANRFSEFVDLHSRLQAPIGTIAMNSERPYSHVVSNLISRGKPVWITKGDSALGDLSALDAGLRNGIVVSPSAVSTMLHTNTGSLLEIIPWLLLVPPGCRQEITPLLQRFLGESVSTSFDTSQGRPRVVKLEKSEAEMRHRRIAALLTRLEVHGQEEGWQTLANLKVKIRTRLDGFLPVGECTAFTIAQERGGVVWTDDLWGSQAYSLLTKSKLTTLSTRGLVELMMLNNRLSAQEADLLVGQMLALGYRSLAPSPGAMVEALQFSNWGLDSKAFAHIAWAVQAASIPPAALVGSILQVTIEVQRRCDESGLKRVLGLLLQAASERADAHEVMPGIETRLEWLVRHGQVFSHAFLDAMNEALGKSAESYLERTGGVIIVKSLIWRPGRP